MDELPHPLPADQTAALAEAAGKIATLNELLPENHVTRSDATTSHHIGQDYIVRLKHAGEKSGISANCQVFLGAALGSAVGGIASGIDFYSKPLAELKHSDILNMMVFGCCVVICIILMALSVQKKETVGDICSEIENRKKAKA